MQILKHNNLKLLHGGVLSVARLVRAVRLDSGSEMEHWARLDLCPWGKRRVCISKCDLLLKISVHSSYKMICATKPWIITTITLSFVCLSKPEYDDSDEDLVVPCCWSLQEDFDNAAAADRRSYCLLTICLDSHHCCIELHCMYSGALTPMKTHLASLLIWARTIWKRTLWLEFKNFGIKCGDTFAPLTIDSCLVNS